MHGDICIPGHEYKERIHRAGADPAYPELKADTFSDVFKGLGIAGKKLRIGVASYLDTSVVVMDGIKKAFPEAEIVRADHAMVEPRSIKSENEIACLKEGYRLAELASQQVIKEIRPGMTELQMVGVAQRAIYENGAEYEGLPGERALPSRKAAWKSCPPPSASSTSSSFR